MSAKSLVRSAFIPLAQMAALAAAADTGPLRGYYLPGELPFAPAHHQEARDATLKLCLKPAGHLDRLRCGNGVIVSNDGYVLTSRHLLNPVGEGEEPQAMGFGPHARLVTVYRSETSDFAILKMIQAPSSPLHGKKLICVPLSRSTPNPGSMLWTIGFPMSEMLVHKNDSCTMETHADSFRKLTTMGPVTYLSPELLRKRGFQGDTKFWNSIDGQRTGEAIFGTYGISAGMSGGPAIDRDGDLVGINKGGTIEDPDTKRYNYGVLTGAGFARAEIERAQGAEAARAFFGCERIPSPSRRESGARLGDRFGLAAEGSPTPELIQNLRLVLLNAWRWAPRFFASLEQTDPHDAQEWALWTERFSSMPITANRIRSMPSTLQLLADEDIYPGLPPMTIEQTAGTAIQELVLERMAGSALTSSERQAISKRLESFIAKKIGKVRASDR